MNKKKFLIIGGLLLAFLIGVSISSNPNRIIDTPTLFPTVAPKTPTPTKQSPKVDPDYIHQVGIANDLLVNGNGDINVFSSEMQKVILGNGNLSVAQSSLASAQKKFLSAKDIETQIRNVPIGFEIVNQLLNDETDKSLQVDAVLQQSLNDISNGNMSNAVKEIELGNKLNNEAVSIQDKLNYELTRLIQIYNP